MRHLLRALILLLICAVALFASACSSASQHQKAIEQAIVGYADYYIEVRNLKSQVEEAYRNIDPKQSTVTYTITVNIPDYLGSDFQSIPFSVPAPDFSPKSIEQYQKKAVLALRQTLETYALKNPVSTYLDLPISFDVVSSGDGWAASISGKSKAEIAQAVEGQMLQILQSSDDYSSNYHLSLVADELYALLADAMGGAEYAALVQISQIESNPDGTFTALLSYPDPEQVYSALGKVYVESFHQSFYGDPLTVSLTTEGLDAIDTSAFPRLEDRVVLSLDAETNTCSLLDAGALLNRISTAQQQANEAATAEVDATWHIQPLDPPESGAVLEGESSGNQLVLKTGATLGRYYYVRFYAISGADVSEEGTLSAGMFVVGGKSAKINLPSGYYRISCFVGSDWYGPDVLFGKDAKQYAGKSAVESREGYVNTISFQ